MERSRVAGFEADSALEKGRSRDGKQSGRESFAPWLMRAGKVWRQRAEWTEDYSCMSLYKCFEDIRRGRGGCESVYVGRGVCMGLMFWKKRREERRDKRQERDEVGALSELWSSVIKR